MDKETALLLVKYNGKANGDMNECIKKLDSPDWEKEWGGYYKSIKALCSHLYVADIAWLKRFSLLRDFAYIKDPLFSQDIGWNTKVFDSVADYAEKRKRLDEILGSFAAELTTTDIGKNLAYKNIKGEAQDRNAGGLVLHIFNHQTHHRGMISLYLEMSGVANDFSNLAALV